MTKPREKVANRLNCNNSMTNGPQVKELKRITMFYVVALLLKFIIQLRFPRNFLKPMFIDSCTPQVSESNGYHCFHFFGIQKEGSNIREANCDTRDEKNATNVT